MDKKCSETEPWVLTSFRRNEKILQKNWSRSDIFLTMKTSGRDRGPWDSRAAEPKSRPNFDLFYQPLIHILMHAANTSWTTWRKSSQWISHLLDNITNASRKSFTRKVVHWTRHRKKDICRRTFDRTNCCYINAGKCSDFEVLCYCSISNCNNWRSNQVGRIKLLEQLKQLRSCQTQSIV